MKEDRLLVNFLENNDLGARYQFVTTEKELRGSQKQMQAVIDFLPDPTLVIDREGKVIFWNRAMEEMTGVPAQEILGKGNYEHAIPFYGERRPILIDDPG